MKSYINPLISLMFLSMAFNLAGQTNLPSATEKLPKDFVSDGCTRFPDGDFRDCCEAHDLKYYYGGSWRQRWSADNELRKCVAAKPGFQHKPISIIMWLGVRVFGVPWLPTRFRWGFGKVKKSEPKNKATR